MRALPDWRVVTAVLASVRRWLLQAKRPIQRLSARAWLALVVLATIAGVLSLFVALPIRFAGDEGKLHIRQEIQGSIVLLTVELEGSSPSGHQSLFVQLADEWSYQEETAVFRNQPRKPLQDGNMLIWPDFRPNEPISFGVVPPESSSHSPGKFSFSVRDDNGNSLLSSELQVLAPIALDAIAASFSASNETRGDAGAGQPIEVRDGDILSLSLRLRNEGPFAVGKIQVSVNLLPLTLSGLAAGDEYQVAFIEPQVTISGRTVERAQLKQGVTVHTQGPAVLEYIPSSTVVEDDVTGRLVQAEDITTGVTLLTLQPGEDGETTMMFEAAVREIATEGSPRAEPTQLDFVIRGRGSADQEYRTEVELGAQDSSVTFRVYLYPSDTLDNGNLAVELNQEGEKLQARAVFWSDQTHPVYSDAVVHMPVGKKLVYRKMSTRAFGYKDSVGIPISDVNLVSPLTCGPLRLNYVPGGKETYKQWYVFQMDVVDQDRAEAEVPPSLEMRVEAANISTGSEYIEESLRADIGDEIAFRMYVHNRIVGTTAEQLRARIDMSHQPQGVVLSGVVTGSTGISLREDMRIDIPSDAWLEYRRDSSTLYSSATRIEESIPDVNGESMLLKQGYYIGDLRECQAWNDRWFTVYFRVTPDR